MGAIEHFIRNNEAYAAEFDPGEADLPSISSIAVVTCMDARMNVGALLGLSIGDAHIIRNAGGVVSEDVIRSLVISQRLLGTREIMLIHHTDCGMQKFSDEDLKAQIYDETGIRPSFAMESFGDLDADVRQSIARIKANPFILHKDIVRGFVYEMETGRLREVS
jgi:carbonic anhydrase